MQFSYSINEAKITQAPTIAQCWKRIDDGLTETPFEDDQASKVQRARDIIAHAISSPTAHVLVAEVDGEVVGTVTGHIYQRPVVKNAAIGVIYSLWVAPEHRQQGIGQSLVDTIEQQLILMGADAFQVGWDTCNHYAASWWQSRGYKPYETIASKSVNTEKQAQTGKPL